MVLLLPLAEGNHLYKCLTCPVCRVYPTPLQGTVTLTLTKDFFVLPLLECQWMEKRKRLTTVGYLTSFAVIKIVREMSRKWFRPWEYSFLLFNIHYNLILQLYNFSPYRATIFYSKLVEQELVYHDLRHATDKLQVRLQYTEEWVIFSGNTSNQIHRPCKGWEWKESWCQKKNKNKNRQMIYFRQWKDNTLITN